MTKSLQKIEQELKILSEQVEEVKKELSDRYVRYLDVLGNSLKKHLSMVVYQICTQTYPHLFLKLTVQERQELQKKIRAIGDRGCEDFSSALERAEHLKLPSATNDIRETILKKLPITEEQLKMLRERLFQSVKDESDEEKKEDKENFQHKSLNMLGDDEDEILEIDDEDEILEIDNEDDDDRNEGDDEDVNPIQDPHHPIHLVNFVKRVEQVLVNILQELSNQTNQLLQASKIFSSKLPPQVLEAAIEADGSGSAVGNSPNTLNLLIEAENERSSKESMVMQVTAVRLRLSEIEFAEPSLSVERNRIRELGKKVKKLYKYYEKLQREKAIAEAEIAWRSIWYEES
ncbi:hypothetical protein [Spirulina sp. 06S082]|uniref:hypothetical protein n=1 Tax=Spirulina sp. 06S082 TaxID=3110248 RepID=UPI002B1EC548|nr:hypothetical protein [Spirulina sp. 06S082]MEA5468773.1 hypothetical protein [Spirulina sp. 06S082]